MPVKNFVSILVKVQFGNVGFINIEGYYIGFYRILFPVDSIRYNAIELVCTKNILGRKAHTAHCVVITEFFILRCADPIPMVAQFSVTLCLGLDFQEYSTKFFILGSLGFRLRLEGDNRIVALNLHPQGVGFGNSCLSIDRGNFQLNRDNRIALRSLCLGLIISQLHRRARYKRYCGVAQVYLGALTVGRYRQLDLVRRHRAGSL